MEGWFLLRLKPAGSRLFEQHVHIRPSLSTLLYSESFSARPDAANYELTRRVRYCLTKGHASRRRWIFFFKNLIYGKGIVALGNDSRIVGNGGLPSVDLKLLVWLINEHTWSLVDVFKSKELSIFLNAICVRAIYRTMTIGNDYGDLNWRECEYTQWCIIIWW